MAEMKFNCPSCTQLIACDELWIGQEIQCPICAKSLTVPSQQEAAGNPLVPKPPAGGASRLSIGQARHQSATAPPQAPRTGTPMMSGAAMKGKKRGAGAGRAKTFAVWGVVLLALAAGGYFGWPYLKKYQDKFSAKTDEAAKNSDGGQVGHIASLNNVLDATDPGRPGGPRLPSDVGRVSRQPGMSRPGMPQPGLAQPATAGGETNLPVVPATYSLDLATAKIPEGRVNGAIAGTNFVADVVRLDPSAGAYVFRALQGTVMAPEMGLVVYLHLKAGETLTNHTWKITPETTGGPTVVKLWKSNPKYAAKPQNFSSGYALNLELGEIKDGQISGKLFLAFPDAEKSYAAGVFTAQTTVGAPPGSQPAPVTATPTPATPVQDPAQKAAFDKRYGIGGKR